MRRGSFSLAIDRPGVRSGTSMWRPCGSAISKLFRWKGCAVRFAHTPQRRNPEFTRRTDTANQTTNAASLDESTAGRRQVRGTRGLLLRVMEPRVVASGGGSCRGVVRSDYRRVQRRLLGASVEIKAGNPVILCRNI